jgi:hypothetical protein
MTDNERRWWPARNEWVKSGTSSYYVEFGRAEWLEMNNVHGGVTMILPRVDYDTTYTIVRESPRVVYRDREVPVVKEVVVEKEVPKIIYIEKEVPMWSWYNILIVALICVAVSKFVLPRLNWKFGIRWFVRLFWKPAKKEAKTIRTEWEEANKE